MTQELLLKMFQHKFELKMWDTKDKVSAKARFDRPKAFRLPQTKNQDEVDLEAIRSMLKQAGNDIIHLGTGSSSLVSQGKGIIITFLLARLTLNLSRLTKILSPAGCKRGFRKNNIIGGKFSKSSKHMSGYLYLINLV